MTEEYYDNEIAPKLAELAMICTGNGMSFFAAVEYEPGEIGEIRMLVPECSRTILHLSQLVSEGYTPPVIITVERRVTEDKP